jgi:macrolide transport system ATP-binding/permease protein
MGVLPIASLPVCSAAASPIHRTEEMSQPSRDPDFHKARPVPGVFARDLSLSVAGRPLLVGADFALAAGRKAALVGRNGSGKSTLIETILAMSEAGPPPDHVELSGSLQLGPGTVLAAVRQEVQVSFSGPVAAYLDRCAGEVSRAWQDQERWGLALAQGRDDPAALSAYSAALEALTRLGGWDYPGRREQVLMGLGLPPALLTRQVASLSGGEATRVALAGVLLSPANLLLLDEPSNNLDLESLDFLAGWIRDSAASLLLVSHDRDLLDATIQELWEIDEESATLISYGGNYSFYAERRREAFEARLRAFGEQQQRRGQLEASAERLARRAERFERTSQNDFYRGKAARVARAASAQRGRVRRQLGELSEPAPPAQPRFTVQSPAITSGTVLRANGLAFSHAGSPVFHGLDLSLRAGRRLAVTGPNGSGKSTLLRLLAGELTPTGGTVEREAAMRVAHLPQVSTAEAGQSALDFAVAGTDASREEVRAILGKVLFADPARVRAGDLSVGQLRRAACAALFASRPDLLLLDEPTNHLDLPAIDMLERALDEFSGAVVACSHDRRFLQRFRAHATLALRRGGEVAYSDL